MTCVDCMTFFIILFYYKCSKSYFLAFWGMRKQVAIYFGMKITKISEKGKWQIFLVGERKVFFWKKGDRIKENIGGKKIRRGFLKMSTDST